METAIETREIRFKHTIVTIICWLSVICQSGGVDDLYGDFANKKGDVFAVGLSKYFAEMDLI